MVEPLPSVEASDKRTEVESRRADYNRLARTARLRSLVLENIDFKIKPETLAAENKVRLKRTVSAETKIISTGVQDGNCVGNIVWSIDSKLEKKRVVQCRVSYMIAYDGIADCSEETVQLFLDNVGKGATYAYLRSLYASLDWNADLGGPPLPVIQFLPKV